jgi:hypothetical protein
MSSCIDLTGQEARSDKGQHPPAVESRPPPAVLTQHGVSPALTVHGDKNQEQGRIFAVRSTAGTPIESPTT